MSDTSDTEARLERLAERILAADEPEQVRNLTLDARLDPGEEHMLLQILREAAFEWPPDAPPDYLRNAWRVAWASAVLAPTAAAPLLHTLGRAFNDSGQYGQAPDPYLGARLAYEQLNDRNGWARITNNLASSYYSLGDYEQAEHFARQALEHFRADPKQPRAEGVCWLTLGNILADRQEVSEAIAAFQQAIAAFNRVPSVDVLRVGSTLVGIGRVLEEQLDDFSGAEQQFKQAETIYKQRPEVDWRRFFTLYFNQGVLFLRLGKHAEARHYLMLAKQQLQPEHIDDLADVLIYEAYQDLLIGQKAHARQSLEQVFRLYEVNPGFNQTTLKYQEKRQIVDASFFLALANNTVSESLAILEEVERKYQQLKLRLAPALVAMERARLYYVNNRYELARNCLAQARQILCQENSPNQPVHRIIDIDVLYAEYDQDVTISDIEVIKRRVEEIGDPNQLLPILFRIGALQESLDGEQAKQTYRQAIEVTFRASGLARLSLQTTRILQRIRYPFERLFVLSRAMVPGEAYLAAEQARVQILLDDLFNERLPHFENIHDPLVAELKRRREHLNMVRARINILAPRYISTDVRSVSTHNIRDELSAAQIAYDQARKNISARQSLNSDMLSLKVANDHTITQQAIDHNTAILSYFLTSSNRIISEERHYSGELWVMVLLKEGYPHIHRLMSPKDVQIFIKEWHSTLQQQLETVQDTRVVNEILFAIAEDVLAPIWPLVQHCRNLIIVPDDRFPLLPFQALRPDGASYLVEQHVVSYTPSTTVLDLCRQRELQRTPGHGALVAGWKGSGSRELKAVPNELRKVASLLNTGARHAPLHLHDIHEALGTAQIIHLACHGSFPKGDDEPPPRFAQLELGGDTLYAYDLYAMHLRADLLTLSACETAQSGVGLQGLFSAGLAAGASSVIASLWHAHDTTTAELMPRFYTYLIQHRLGRAEALRQAQLDLVRPDISPALWAPFILIGVPDPLPMLPLQA